MWRLPSSSLQQQQQASIRQQASTSVNIRRIPVMLLACHVQRTHVPQAHPVAATFQLLMLMLQMMAVAECVCVTASLPACKA